MCIRRLNQTSLFAVAPLFCMYPTVGYALLIGFLGDGQHRQFPYAASRNSQFFDAWGGPAEQDVLSAARRRNRETPQLKGGERTLDEFS
jgi:hypothetical protein